MRLVLLDNLSAPEEGSDGSAFALVCASVIAVQACFASDEEFPCSLPLDEQSVDVGITPPIDPLPSIANSEDFAGSLPLEEPPGTWPVWIEPPVTWSPPYEGEEHFRPLTVDEWPATAAPWVLWTEPTVTWTAPYTGEDVGGPLPVDEWSHTSAPYCLWVEPSIVWTAPFSGEDRFTPLSVDTEDPGQTLWTERPTVWTAPFEGEEQFLPLPIDEWPANDSPRSLWTEPAIVWTAPFAGEDQFVRLLLDDEPPAFVYFTPEPAVIWTAPHEGEDQPRFPNVFDEQAWPAVVTYDVPAWAWPQAASEEPITIPCLPSDDPTPLVLTEAPAWVVYSLLGEDLGSSLTVDEGPTYVATVPEAAPWPSTQVAEDYGFHAVTEDASQAWAPAEAPAWLSPWLNEDYAGSVPADETQSFVLVSTETPQWLTQLAEDYAGDAPSEEPSGLSTLPALADAWTYPTRDEEFGAAHPVEETFSWAPTDTPAWLTASISEDFAGSLPWDDSGAQIVFAAEPIASTSSLSEDFGAAHPTEEAAATAWALSDSTWIATGITDEEFGASHPTEESGNAAWALSDAAWIFKGGAEEEFGAAHPTEDAWSLVWAPAVDTATAYPIAEDFAGTLPSEDAPGYIVPSQEMVSWVTAQVDEWAVSNHGIEESATPALPMQSWASGDWLVATGLVAAEDFVFVTSSVMVALTRTLNPILESQTGALNPILSKQATLNPNIPPTRTR